MHEASVEAELALEPVAPPPRRSSVISRRRMRVLRAAAEALLHDGIAAPDESRMAWFLDEADDYAAATGGLTRTLLLWSFTVLQFAPPTSIWRLKRFTSCTIDERQRCLRKLERSPLVFVVLMAAGIKALVGLVYFEHPAALREAGYDGKHSIDKPITPSPRSLDRYVADHDALDALPAVVSTEAT